MKTIIKITKNGEITQDSETKVYTVWDETYSDIVGKTYYYECAIAMLNTYVELYLNGIY